MPKVSVVVPAYNAMRFLPETINSVLGQTLRDFEVIIVNDGSTDNISQWARTLKDERVRLISQTNQGQSSARNTGITQATGDYIAFLDSDDLWTSTKLEKQADVLDLHPEVGLVYAWVSLIDEFSRPTGKVWEIHEEGYIWDKLVKGNIIACGSVPMIRVSCIQEVGLFEKFTYCCEDWDFWLRISAYYPFQVINEHLVYYRASSSSLSRSQSEILSKKLSDMEESYQLVLNRAFNTAPDNLQYLRPRCLAKANLSIAWKALKSSKLDYSHVNHYLELATFHDSTIVFTIEFLKLKLANQLINIFGIENYVNLVEIIKYPLLSFYRRFSKS